MNDDMMLRAVHLDARGAKMTDEEWDEFTSILISYLQDFAADDPKGFEQEYRQYKEAKKFLQASSLG